MRSASVDSDCARAGGACGRKKANETAAQQRGKTRVLFFKVESSKTPEDCLIYARCQPKAAATDKRYADHNSSLIFSTQPLCFRVQGQSPAEGKASWREVWGRVAQWDVAARAGVWRGNWGSPFHFPRPRLLRNCHCGFPPGFCASLPGSVW